MNALLMSIPFGFLRDRARRIVAAARRLPSMVTTRTLLLAMAMAGANMLLWQSLHRPVEAPDFHGRVAGMAYNAFQRWDDPTQRRFPGDESVDGDLALLALHTGRVRSYSSSEIPKLPELAQRHGLKLTAGVWLDSRSLNNRREMEAAKEAAAQHWSIERIIVGNEVLLRGELTVPQLIVYLNEMRKSVGVPVSTAEPWHIWMRYPELARHVDFLTVHLLPYWEGVPVEHALEHAMQRLDQLQRRFPGKRIVIGEIGWPSRGDRFEEAKAGPIEQARFIREFVTLAQSRAIDYYLMEAVDQPWKTVNEGRVGAYWGVLDADRTPKFPMSGPIVADPHWAGKAALASLLAFVPVLGFLAAFARMRLASRLMFAAMIQAVASLGVWLLALPFEFYLRASDWVALLLLVPSLGAMVAILLANGFEFVEMYWPGNLRRGFAPKPLPAGAREPRVSIHLACCNEPPEMVIATLESLDSLAYGNFEVLVVDNNTKDEALWRPVEACVARLGDRFRFFHLPSWPGFKAGALNFALSNTDPQAEIVGVVDADYVVRRDWLSSLVGHFCDPGVAVVQAPQAHREWHRQPLRRMMNFEYDGFFRIGMHHRNERDAIIQHGTMTLIRAHALREHGQWAEWTICEDAELGLRLMRAGLSTVYVDRVMGEGLTPEDFASFRKQRRRWAQGAMQILKGHWRALIAGEALTAGQRYHFLTGWMSWFGDALHLVFAFAAMFWTLGVLAAPHAFSLPIALFMTPLFVFFVVKALFGPLLYARRVRCTPADIAGSALAGMGLSHAIARGVFSGLVHRRAVFEITRKAAGEPGPSAPGHSGAAKAANAARAAGAVDAAHAGSAAAARALGERALCDVRALPVREEALLFTGLVVCALGVALTRIPGHLESAMWMTILVLQSLPYAAALACEVLSRVPERRAHAGQAPPATATQSGPPLQAPQPAFVAAAQAEPAGLAPTSQRAPSAGALAGRLHVGPG